MEGNQLQQVPLHLLHAEQLIPLADAANRAKLHASASAASDEVVAMPLYKAVVRHVPLVPWLPSQILHHVVVPLVHNKLAYQALPDDNVGPGDDVECLTGVSGNGILLWHR